MENKTLKIVLTAALSISLIGNIARALLAAERGTSDKKYL